MLPERSQRAGLELDSPFVNQLEGTQNALDHGWWTLYEDEQLNQLIAQAFVESPDINQIRARLEQTQAVRRQNFASLIPNFEINGQRSTFRAAGNSPPSGINFLTDADDPPSNFTALGAASYELDIWGKNQADIKAAKLSEEATRQDLYAAGTTLSANIVENWLNILSLREQEAIIREQIEINETVLELQGLRFEQGNAAALDVLQQEENLARTQALLPDILSNQRQAMNNITVLVGQFPAEDFTVSERDFPGALDIPEAGLPSDLLENRPDIAAAWARLLASDYETYSAFTERLPAFQLTANFTSSVTRLRDIVTDWLLELAAGVSAPIFNGGNLRAQRDLQAAIADENLYLYQDTILQAALDVENALTQNNYQDLKLDALHKQLDASQKTLEQAQLSYANGESDYINVLNSLTNSQTLEQQIAVERLLQAQNRVGLYRALGGRHWIQEHLSEELSDE